jgi:hypothetical protein
MRSVDMGVSSRGADAAAIMTVHSRLERSRRLSWAAIPDGELAYVWLVIEVLLPERVYSGRCSNKIQARLF